MKQKKENTKKERPIHLTSGQPGRAPSGDMGRCGQRKNKDAIADDLNAVTCLFCLHAFAQRCQEILDSIVRNAARPR
jgi:hypothetical protein